MITIIFIILLATYVNNQPTSLTYFVSIQIQSQSYFSYLPLIQTCTYPNTSIIGGEILLVPIDKKNIFDRIVQVGVLEFWAPVLNGPEIAMALDIQSTQFQGYILYNSPDKDLNRPIIFFNITSQASLMFYFTFVTINKQTLQLYFNVIDKMKVQLSQSAHQLVMECSTVTTYNFAYLGNSSFMFVCGEYAQGFIFDPWLGANSTIMHNFSTQIGVYKLAPDPTLMIDYDQIYTPFWNAVLLIQKGQIFSQFYFIIYKGENFTMESMDNQNKTLQLIINKLWGQQASVQFERLMDLYSSLKIQRVYFPGEIASIFISQRQNIFVQSVTPTGQTYLCVFNSRGQIQWNITFNGSVIYFGNQITLIYSYRLKVFYKVEVTRPIYIISPSDFSNLIPATFNYFNFILPCQSVNITINYQIFWSTILYPSAYFQLLEADPISSEDSTFAVQTLEKFLIIGPAIDIIPSPPEGLEVYIINYKTAVIHSKTVAVFSMEKHSYSIEGIMLVTSNSIFYITPRGKVITLVSQPCGFNSIMSAQLSAGSNYCTLVNSNGQVCLCQPNFMVCSLVTSSSFETQTSLEAPNNFTNKTNMNSINRLRMGNQSFLIKKTFLDLIQRNIIVSILQNNTVVIYDLVIMKTYNSIDFKCNGQNLTNGIIFIKEFFSPSLILYCEGQTTISQYIIRQDEFMLQRVIPLYGFQTVTNFYGIQKTSSFIFLSVLPIDGVVIQNCCVLRINPEKFTVSAIVQVILAEYLVATATYINYDFVIVENITDNGPYTIINVYIPNEWISFNQTNNSQLVTQYQNLTFYFSSPIYNFYSYMVLQITFNLTRADLILLSQDENPQTILFHVLKNSRTEQYQYILSYNMSNFICGPVFNSYFRGTNEKVLVEQTDTLMTLKLIGSYGIVYTQLINPEHWNQPNFTFNNLLLFVTSDTMQVYAKSLDNTQMVLIYNFALPQNQCTYYLYQIINSSAANLTSNCDGASFKLQTPLLTINYDPSLTTNNFTHSYSYMEIAKALRNLQTINVNSSYVLIIGVIEGPTYSPSGRLVICHQQTCSYLFISSNLEFLLDYSSFSGANQTYFVMAIGIATIDVFINPIPNNNTYITPNYTISYSQQIKQTYCSVIKILNATQTSSVIILSGTKFYYYVSINFTTNQLRIIQKYERYSQCNLFDQFKPSCVYENETLFMILAECRQNGYKTTLDFYVGATSSAIYTGYLQVFTDSGPFGSSCTEKTFSPIRIVPLSTSMYFPVYIIYKVGNIYKFLYSSIDGFLIDNRLQFLPQVKIVFVPSQQNYEYPILDFYAYNQFHFETEIMQTKKSIDVPYKKYPLYILIIVFSIINFVTLIFLISYFFIGLPAQEAKIEKKQDSQYFQSQDSLTQSLLNPSQYSLQPNRPLSNRMSEITTKSRPYELELFFVKNESEPSFKKTL